MYDSSLIGPETQRNTKHRIFTFVLQRSPIDARRFVFHRTNPTPHTILILSSRVEFFKHLTPVFLALIFILFFAFLFFFSSSCSLFHLLFIRFFLRASSACQSKLSKCSSLLLLKCKPNEKMKIFFFDSHFLYGFHYHLKKNLCAVNCMYCIECITHHIHAVVVSSSNYRCNAISCVFNECAVCPSYKDLTVFSRIKFAKHYTYWNWLLYLCSACWKTDWRRRRR